MRGMRGRCWMMCVLMGLFVSHVPQAAAQPTQRYLALMMLNLDTRFDADLDILPESIKAGCNAVNLTIHWDFVYPKPNSPPNWAKYDNQINICQKLGVKVAIRIYVGRGINQIEGFWTRNDCQRDDRGKPLQAIYDKTFFSFAHRPSVDKSCDFIREVCQRYNTLQNQGVISWIAVTPTTAQEMGYDFVNFSPGGSYFTVYDYSTAMQEEFRIYLSRKYKKITRLNATWDTEHARFEDIGPPTSPTEPSSVFIGPQGRDWYVFRHLMLRSYVEKTTEVIKNVNKSYLVMLDFGSVYDQLSGLRASYGFPDLNRTTDGVKINDEPTSNNHFSTDIVRSNVGNKWVLNEVFPIDQYTKADIQKQIDHSFERGTHWINVVIGTMPVFNRIKDILQKSNERWLKTPFVKIVPQRSFSYSLARVAEFGYFGSSIDGQWAAQAGPVGNRQAVNMQLNDDLIADSLQGAINRVPVVKNALPTKVSKVNTPFSYKLSSEVFVDIDGAIVKVEAIDLPRWLTFSNNNFSGIPTSTGTYTFKLRATDDDGATVETKFSILIDNNGRLNQRPVLRKAIANVAGLYKQAFITQIPDSTFFDPDGFIARLEVVGTPKWAQYRKGEFRGVPDQALTYNITVRAFDDEEASVETTFQIVINFPSVFFDLIEGGPPGKRRLIQRLKPNDKLLAHAIPTLLNIYASCDASFDEFELELLGPYYQAVKVNRSPYSLFNDSNGFPNVAGSYELKGKAYFRKQLVASTVYPFEIVPTISTTKQPIVIEDWAAYPNPFDDFLTIKLPDNAPPQGWRLEITTLTGQQMPVPSRSVTILNKSLSVNVGTLGVAPGTYVLKLIHPITSDTKTFKVVKR